MAQAVAQAVAAKTIELISVIASKAVRHQNELVAAAQVLAVAAVKAFTVLGVSMKSNRSSHHKPGDTNYFLGDMKTKKVYRCRVRRMPNALLEYSLH